MKYRDRKCRKCRHMAPKRGVWCRKHVPKTFSGMFSQAFEKTITQVAKDMAVSGTGVMRIFKNAPPAWGGVVISFSDIYRQSSDEPSENSHSG